MTRGLLAQYITAVSLISISECKQFIRAAALAEYLLVLLRNNTWPLGHGMSFHAVHSAITGHMMKDTNTEKTRSHSNNKQIIVLTEMLFLSRKDNLN